MKKLTIIAALVASAFTVSANAGTTSASVNITGKITPAACTISTSGEGGTIDFGTIRSSELTNERVTKKQTGSLNIACDTETTALIKVTNNTGLGTDERAFKTDKDYVTYFLAFKDLNAQGGTASNTVLITTNKLAEIDMKNLQDVEFKKSAAGAIIPGAGRYFGAAANGDGDTATVGTFKTLTANFNVMALIDSAAAKEAVKSGEQTFNSVVNLELEYI